MIENMSALCLCMPTYTVMEAWEEGWVPRQHLHPQPFEQRYRGQWSTVCQPVHGGRVQAETLTRSLCQVPILSF